MVRSRLEARRFMPGAEWNGGPQSMTQPLRVPPSAGSRGITGSWGCVWITLLLVVCLDSHVAGQHQTESFSPVLDGAQLPYQVDVRSIDFGTPDLPTLHSFAAARHDGLWVLLAGRTNGLHGFSNVGTVNFPPSFQNRAIWVIDPGQRRVWSRSLDDASSGLSAAQIATLTPTNNQFFQRGDRLYMAGGYGALATGGFDTFDSLSAIDLPGIVSWVTQGTGRATDSIRQIRDPLVKVTGGAMYEIEGRTHLVFGQDFTGAYVPGRTGVYTDQVRSFDILDDGTTLAIANPTVSPVQDAYHRRDLNVYPSLRRGAGGDLEQGLVALSGVFTDSNGAWTVPVEIDALGDPFMSDPVAPGTFKQAMNNYHSAKLGLYSSVRDQMHEVLFGGITIHEYDAMSGQIVRDDAMPFTSQMTSVVRDGEGNYAQYFLGAFPQLTDLTGNLLRFGSNAEFFLAPDIPTRGDGLIDLDSLSGETRVGYIYGGIVSNAPHVRNVAGALSAASDDIFEVWITVVPEPSGIAAMVVAIPLLVRRRQSARTISPRRSSVPNDRGAGRSRGRLPWVGAWHEPSHRVVLLDSA